MLLPAFIARLLADGRTAVPAPGVVSADERAQIGATLREFEQDWRLGMPGAAPAFHEECATWAAVQFYRACQYAVFRDAGPDFQFESLDRESERAVLFDAHYSIDLTWRFLPDLVKQLRALASEDPLLVELLRWARRWPLSSVGVAGVELDDASPALAAIVGSPSLLGLYVDRVIDRRDASRLNHPAVRQAVAAAIGLHHELAPQLAGALRTPEKVTT